MGVLELRAIHLDNGAAVAEQNLRRRFHDARLAGPGRAKEQQVAYRTARRVQTSTENLKEVHKCLHPFGLSDDLRAQCAFKVSGACASYAWI
jgi:hypothetical protein